MAAPKGNSNYLKGSQWADMLRIAVMTYETPTVKRGQALRAIADVVVGKALEGDKDSIQELANRLDGKPNVTIDQSLNVNHTGTIEHLAVQAASERIRELLGSDRTNPVSLPH